jgi:MraZ protein
MFAGSHLLTIDDKGRLPIPARFRQQLADEYGMQVFITRSYQPCVEIYPAPHFRTVADQIEGLADRSRADWLTQIFIGNAVETEVDKQGRVLLPQLLRKYARLDGAVVVVGQNKRMDIWSEDVWTKKFGEEASEDLAGAFALLKR